MPYFPLFIDIEGKKILVVGGGAVATRRVESLLTFGASITVAAPRVSERIEELGRRGRIEIVREDWKAYAARQEESSPWMVLAAADSAKVNEQAAAWGRSRGALVNTAHDRSGSDFYFPGLAVQGEVVAAVTAGGGDHRMAAYVSGRIRAELAEIIRDGEALAPPP